jgi:hypothetical protein
VDRFGGKRFHQEAVRLHAGEAVGDGLLLGFLEGEGVVERAGEEIGERAQQSDIRIGKITAFGGFDVENAEESLAVGDGQRDAGD